MDQHMILDRNRKFPIGPAFIKRETKNGSRQIRARTMATLEPFGRSDFDKLISWVDNEESLLQFAGPIFKYPLTTEQLETYLKDKNRDVFKVVDSETKETIGHSEIYKHEEHITRLCRMLIGDKKYRGRGLGQQIVKQLTAYSFDKLGALSVELSVYDWNTRAIRCYQKVGFSINVSKLYTVVVNGRIWTAINMTLDKTQ